MPALATAILEALARDTFPERDSARQQVFAAMGPEIVAQQHEALYREVMEGKMTNDG